jgi:mannonate dehydratase
MQLASVLTPLSDENLQLAAQCGVTDLVHRYPGPGLAAIREAQARVGRFGLRLAVIEGYLPIENLKLGCDDGREVAALRQLIRDMGEAGIQRLCYNFMAGTDWARTRLDAPERGGLSPGGCGARGAAGIRVAPAGRRGACAAVDS